MERPTRFIDADGCSLVPGMMTWEPWRWGRVRKASRGGCSLSRGVRMRDPETGECLQRYHELAFEV